MGFRLNGDIASAKATQRRRLYTKGPAPPAPPARTWHRVVGWAGHQRMKLETQPIDPPPRLRYPEGAEYSDHRRRAREVRNDNLDQPSREEENVPRRRLAFNVPASTSHSIGARPTRGTARDIVFFCYCIARASQSARPSARTTRTNRGHYGAPSRPWICATEDDRVAVPARARYRPPAAKN